MKPLLTGLALVLAASALLSAQTAAAPKRAVHKAAAAAAAAPPPGQTFATPQAAAQALITAAENNDTPAMLKLFGPQGADIVESGNPDEDKSARAEFTRRAHEKLDVRIEPANPGRATIITGVDNWPFPVPLIRLKSGEWFFDSPRGRTEILARRIGRNELVAIDVMRGYVEAQMQYAAHDRVTSGTLEYAQRLLSSPGKKDGLYTEGEATNLVPKGLAAAAESVSETGKRVPYHGYYFRILTAQGPDAPGGAHDYMVKGKMIGGFGLIAYPAEYGASGIKTFIVNQDGVVYEKDLGPTTAALARHTMTFNPSKAWHAVSGE